MSDGRFVIHPSTRIGSVHLTVADLDRQIGFYREWIGFQLHWQEGNRAGLGTGGEDLLQLTQEAEARRIRGTTGLYHFAILLPGRRELARALARLIARRYPNYPTDHVMTETTYLDDPEGNGIELYADTPQRGTWSFTADSFQVIDAQGVVRSGREPLDVEGLLRELRPDDRLDQAMPPDTTIGHVHLHVADLAEANRFYCDLLGFEIQGMSEAMGASFVSAGGYHHHIGLNTWLGRGAPSPAPEALGLRHFTIRLPDAAELERVAARVRAAGVERDSTERGLLLHDPSRNGVLLSDRPETAWPVR
jgi:catechol 2,3-dioxygenase